MRQQFLFLGKQDKVLFDRTRPCINYLEEVIAAEFGNIMKPMQAGDWELFHLPCDFHTSVQHDRIWTIYLTVGTELQARHNAFADNKWKAGKAQVVYLSCKINRVVLRGDNTAVTRMLFEMREKSQEVNVELSSCIHYYYTISSMFS